MNFDFQAIMLLALLATGVIWAVDALKQAPRRRQALAEAAAAAGGELDVAAAGKIAREPLLVEYARSFFPIILIVLLLRSFIVEPFRIPSASMMPTLLAGDFILVNKYTYGIRLPLMGTKIIDVGEPRRGDVVVFRYPKDPSLDYIKRVVGLPGDHISYFNKTVYINGKAASQKSLGLYTGLGAGLSMTGASMRQEQLGDVKHRILIMNPRKLGEGEYVVPQGRYFVMCDNRDNSNDSRFWGTVPEENLVGRAFMIWFSWNAEESGVNWARIGEHIQ